MWQEDGDPTSSPRHPHVHIPSSPRSRRPTHPPTSPRAPGTPSVGSPTMASHRYAPSPQVAASLAFQPRSARPYVGSPSSYDQSRLNAPPMSSLGSGSGILSSSMSDEGYLRERDLWSPDTPQSTLNSKPLPSRSRTVSDAPLQPYTNPPTQAQIRAHRKPPPAPDLTPASAIAYAYQQQHSPSPNPSPRPGVSPNPSYIGSSSYSECDGPYGPYNPTPNSSTLFPPKESSKTEVLRSLGRKVSVKFRRSRTEDAMMGSSPSPSSDIGESPSPYTRRANTNTGGSSTNSHTYLHPLDPPRHTSQPTPRLSKPKSLLRLSSKDPPTSPAKSDPPTPEGTASGIWKLVKKFSSSTLREGKRTSNSTELVPPVPPLPPLAQSHSRRSSDDQDYGILIVGHGGGGGWTSPKPIRSRSGTLVSSHRHRGSTSHTLSSSPISSDLSSSRYFFGRNPGSPRTSTSSYVTDATPPPPLPVVKRIMPVPVDEMDALLKEYESILGPYAGEDYADEDLAPRLALKPPLNPPRSRSREPAASRKSSSSARRDSGELRAPISLRKYKGSLPPNLAGLGGNDGLMAAKYVAVQDVTPTTATYPKPPPEKEKELPKGPGLIRRLTRSKSEANIASPPIVSPVPFPSTPSPALPRKSESAPRRSNFVLPVRSPRAQSFDSPPSSRPISFSTTVAFRELSGGTVKRTEDEKIRMWDTLLEKSAMAGGTIHAKIDSKVF